MKIIRFIVKLLVRAFFWAWVLNQILPPVLSEYKPFEWFFRVNGYLGNAMSILAIGLFLLTLIPRKQTPVDSTDRTTLILHDSDPEIVKELFAHVPNATFYCASPKMASCRGFYDCWLRTPGTCALRDGFENLGRKIGECDDLIIVSKSLYGCYSKEIKNALDRSISFALPYFKMVEWEVHHQERFSKRGGMTIYVYDSEDIHDFDKKGFLELAKANVRNMHKNEPRVEFVGSIQEIKESAV